MRDIRFRGKRLDNGKWVEGFLAKSMNDSPCIMPDIFYATRDFGKTDKNGLPVLEPCMALGGFYRVDPSTVGQLWQPSLNVKCYGGDLFTAICSVDDDDESDGLEKKRRIVKICESNSGHYVSVWHMGQWCAYKTMNFTSFVPIGNIHDNA